MNEERIRLKNYNNLLNLVNFYKRNIRNKLLLRRWMLIVFILSIIYLFSSHLNDYAVLLILTVFFLAVFPVTTVSINNDSFEINKYYLLGLLPIKWCFHRKDKIEIFPLTIASEMHHPAVETPTDSWLDIFSVFLSTQKTTHCALIIKSLKMNGNTAQLRENFTVEEFNLIINIMKEKIVVNNFKNHTT